jgi:hypothetical protein
MGRRSIAIPTILASFVAVAAIAVIASAGSAQSPAGTTLNLVSKSENKVGFGPNHAPRPGDRVGFGSRYTSGETGYDRGICTFVTKAQALCTVEVKLSKGTLTAQGFVTEAKQKDNPFIITGGSGAYDGARGTAFVTDVSDTTTDIRVELLP